MLWHVFRYDATGTHHGPFPDSDIRENDTVCTDPDVITDDYRSGYVQRVVIQIMIRRDYDGIAPDIYVVPDNDRPTTRCGYDHVPVQV
jgi:hypothetical protein